MATNTGKAVTMESRILQSEEILRAKQEQIRKFIEANYGQILDRQKEIQQVEAELAALQMEAKQTVNPRKQALEFLRKKIEQQGERTSQAKAKEVQTKKAYEDAVQIARAEEQEKEKLSNELQALVQETASSQLERLEQLTRRLELLSGGAHSLLQASSQDGNKSSETQQAELPPKASDRSTATPTESSKVNYKLDE
ncbi:hypothetical protein KFL_001940050 [Klebsormidium nitens]|uniref:RAB6-interacting golgin n=1 Tax=Klebsormidium nitens TaxID=105231 RepID=A0A1Y1I8X7_KLENI|nr:hypothetical protein KFL_001940050 [Klebsormidium nitens]|eukprot:GAQ84548.1 hypothetical protein KFL_001940050 [Klebsormidium nitens]